MTDPLWLINATKQEIERKAFLDFARAVAIAIFIGLILVPFVMPWGAQ